MESKFDHKIVVTPIYTPRDYSIIGYDDSAMDNDYPWDEIVSSHVYVAIDNWSVITMANLDQNCRIGVRKDVDFELYCGDDSSWFVDAGEIPQQAKLEYLLSNNMLFLNYV